MALPLGPEWLSAALAGALDMLLCEGDEFGELEKLGAEAGAGLGAALGGGELAALPASWCCARTIEEKPRTNASERPESRIMHLPTTWDRLEGGGRPCGEGRLTH